MKDLTELLIFRTAERDSFEAEAHLLRRERDEAREALQWAGLLVAEIGVNLQDRVKNGVDGDAALEDAVDLLNISMAATGTPLGHDGHELDEVIGIGRRVRRMRCCHNASAQKVDGVNLVCSDCDASAPLFGVMQRLLQGMHEQRWPHGPPIPPEPLVIQGDVTHAREPGVEPDRQRVPAPGDYVSVYDVSGCVVHAAYVTAVQCSPGRFLVDWFCTDPDLNGVHTVYSFPGGRPEGHSAWCTNARSSRRTSMPDV